MIKSIRHTGIVVADLDKAIRFWTEIMGLVVVREMVESGPYIDEMMGLCGVKVKLEAPDRNQIELLYFHSHKDKSSWSGTPYSTGLTHIAFTVENLNDEYERLLNIGVLFPGEPKISPDGRVKVIYVRGPENILIELVEIIE